MLGFHFLRFQLYDVFLMMLEPFGTTFDHDARTHGRTEGMPAQRAPAPRAWHSARGRAPRPPTPTLYNIISIYAATIQNHKLNHDFSSCELATNQF